MLGMSLHRSVALLVLVFAVSVLAFPGMKSTGDPATDKDLCRAKQMIPGANYKGADLKVANQKLNHQLLTKYPGLKTQTCESFTVEEVQQVLRVLYSEISEELGSQYANTDGRFMAYDSVEAMEAHWAKLPGDDAVIRDAMCHEAVMWFAHHLTTGGQQRLAAKTTLPLLPGAVHHDADGEKGTFYQSKVSCQQCHTGPVLPDWVNDTLPLPADEPSSSRQRNCDYQYDPPCGPCDGLGGHRWGDATDQFTPIPCSLVAAPEDVPMSERAPHVYPKMGTAKMNGDARMPLEPPGNSTVVEGSYVPVDGQFFLGWDDEMGRHQYIRKSGSPIGGANATVTLIAKQSMEMIRSNSSAGVMAVVAVPASDPTNKTCVCLPGDAGVMHTTAFADVDPLDNLRLPPSEGGLTYLGRVKVQLETMNKTVVVDHYMKVFFHFLVGAEKGTPEYGLPVLLYAGLGNRFIYTDWVLGDPSKTRPHLWDLPTDTHCAMISPECAQLFKTSS